MGINFRNEQLARDYLASFNEINFSKMAHCFDNQLVAYVTNSTSQADTVVGSEEFIARVKAMNMHEVDFHINLTQILSIEDDLVMVMVEVKASKNTKKLHNFATHLLKIKNNKIIKIWMVEALPAYSEEFWLD